MDGLRRHRDLPFLDLDNNGAERALRTPVIGRKNFYGSGAAWAAHLAAGIWTITATAAQNDTEPLHLLTDYLTACAENGGKPLTGGKLDPFLPWTPQDAPAAPPTARMTPPTTRKPGSPRSDPPAAAPGSAFRCRRPLTRAHRFTDYLSMVRIHHLPHPRSASSGALGAPLSCFRGAQPAATRGGQMPPVVGYTRDGSCLGASVHALSVTLLRLP